MSDLKLKLVALMVGHGYCVRNESAEDDVLFELAWQIEELLKVRDALCLTILAAGGSVEITEKDIVEFDRKKTVLYFSYGRELKTHIYRCVKK